jgi:hypothetical protein
MLKNIITKFNNFIQWTKKWHICHIFVNIYACAFYLTLYCSISNDLNFFINEFEENILTSMLFLYFMLYYALIIVLLIAIIEHLKKTKLRINNKFLLHNKIYHIYYYFHSIILIIVCCYFICLACFSDLWLLLTTLYIITLIVFLAIKWFITSIIDFIFKNKNQKNNL